MTAPLSDDHAAMLAASTITADHVEARGYETITDPQRLEHLQITKAGRNVPGLLVPMLRPDGSTWGYTAFGVIHHQCRAARTSAGVGVGVVSALLQW